MNRTSIENIDKGLYKKNIYALENSVSLDNLITYMNSIFIEELEKNQKSNSIIESSLIISSKVSGIMSIREYS